MRARHLLLLIAWGLAGVAGCTGGPGSRFGFLPPNTHKLSDSARTLRAAHPIAQALPRELDKRLLPSYVVEPGDVLLVQPADLDSPARLPGDQPVLPDGTIQLGKYGKPVVAGKTIEEIEPLIRTLVEAQTKDAGAISVRVVSRVSKVFYVLGEVNAPGSFQLSGRETVLDAIVTAGGLTDRAARDKIILTRPTGPDGCRVVLAVCYNDIVQVGDTSTNYQLAPGDRVFVPSKGFWDDYHKKDKDCGPCNRPQSPCPPVLGPSAPHSHPAPPPAAPPPITLTPLPSPPTQVPPAP